MFLGWRRTEAGYEFGAAEFGAASRFPGDGVVGHGGRGARRELADGVGDSDYAGVTAIDLLEGIYARRFVRVGHEVSVHDDCSLAGRVVGRVESPSLVDRDTEDAEQTRAHGADAAHPSEDYRVVARSLGSTAPDRATGAVVRQGVGVSHGLDNRQGGQPFGGAFQRVDLFAVRRPLVRRAPGEVHADLDEVLVGVAAAADEQRRGVRSEQGGEGEGRGARAIPAASRTRSSRRPPAPPSGAGASHPAAARRNCGA